MHTASPLQAELLLDKGLAYTCNCPRFMHYHTCKHSIALGLHFGKVTVPDQYSLEVTARTPKLELLNPNPNPSSSNPNSPLPYH